MLSIAWLTCVAMFYLGLSRLRPAWLLGSVVAGVILIAGWVQVIVAGRDDATLAELAFLRNVRTIVPPTEPVLINSDVDSLNFFRLQFDLGRSSRLLHNLSYLRDRDLTSSLYYVITRAQDEPDLLRIGAIERLAQAERSHRERSPGQRFTLYRVTPAPDLKRYPRPAYVGVMQAMARKPGPWCGDDWNVRR
jgi:hypothetical protein